MNERIWLYVISKELNAEQLQKFKSNCQAFIDAWTSHNDKLDSSFEIHKNRILVMKVDESDYNAGGCSIDTLHRFIKQQESEFGIELLNRLQVALEVNDEIMVVHSTKIKELLSAGTISENTTVYDISISTSEDLKNWKKTLRSTWLCKYLPSLSS